MSHALAIQGVPLAHEVYALLREMDASRFRRKFADTLRERSALLAERFAAISAEGSLEQALRARYVELATILREHVPAPSEDARRAWAHYRVQLQSAYAQLGHTLRASSVSVPSVRPTNAARSLVHVGCATTIVVLLEQGFDDHLRWSLPLMVGVAAWGMETARHFSARARAFLLWVFSAIAHPHERHRVNSSTWLTTGLVILGLAFAPMFCAVGVAILGYADPAAALVGRRWGRRELINGRSREGSTAFAVVGTLVAWAVLMMWHADLGLGVTFVIALCAALVGAVAELFSGRFIDDNMSIPLASAAGAWLAAQALVFA
jgi:dolichol kinase